MINQLRQSRHSRSFFFFGQAGALFVENSPRTSWERNKNWFWLVDNPRIVMAQLNTFWHGVELKLRVFWGWGRE